MTSLNTSSFAICDCLLELYSCFFCKSTGIITKINYRYKQQNILSCFLLLVFDLFENGLSWSSFVFILTPSICFSITGIFTIFWLLWNSLDPLWSAALQALFLLLFFMFCKFFFFLPPLPSALLIQLFLRTGANSGFEWTGKCDYRGLRWECLPLCWWNSNGWEPTSKALENKESFLRPLTNPAILPDPSLPKDTS